MATVHLCYLLLFERPSPYACCLLPFDPRYSLILGFPPASVMLFWNGFPTHISSCMRAFLNFSVQGQYYGLNWVLIQSYQWGSNEQE